MKVKVKESEVWKPIKIELTIETVKEYKSLWHRLNMGTQSIKNEYFKENLIDRKDLAVNILYVFWDELNKIKPQGEI
jgi:hypothetical protein